MHTELWSERQRPFQRSWLSFSLTGTELRVLPSVVNDLLKEAEQIFKQHGDCEQW
jgi:hypothetical protein